MTQSFNDWLDKTTEHIRQKNPPQEHNRKVVDPKEKGVYIIHVPSSEYSAYGVECKTPFVVLSDPFKDGRSISLQNDNFHFVLSREQALETLAFLKGVYE